MSHQNPEKADSAASGNSASDSHWGDSPLLIPMAPTDSTCLWQPEQREGTLKAGNLPVPDQLPTPVGGRGAGRSRSLCFGDCLPLDEALRNHSSYSDGKESQVLQLEGGVWLPLHKDGGLWEVSSSGSSTRRINKPPGWRGKVIGQPAVTRHSRPGP